MNTKIFENAFYNYLYDIDIISSDAYEYFMDKRYLKEDSVRIDLHHWMKFIRMNTVDPNDIRFIVEFYRGGNHIEPSTDRDSYSEVSIFSIDAIFRLFVFMNKTSIRSFTDKESIEKIESLKQIRFLSDNNCQILKYTASFKDPYKYHLMGMDYDGNSYIWIMDEFLDFNYDFSYRILILNYDYDTGAISINPDYDKWISIDSILNL